MTDRETPLATAQARMWFLQRLDPTDTSEHMTTVRRLVGPLDVAALRHAVDVVVARHEPLRTTYPDRDGLPVARIADRVEVAVAVTDVRGQDNPAGYAVAAAQELGDRPYDLAGGPLLRVALFRDGDESHVLLIGAHHLVSDGWSVRLLLDEIGRAYAGTPLPWLPGTYTDHVMWQQARSTDAAFEYWRDQLVDLPPPRLSLERDVPAPGGPAVYRRRVDPALAEQVAQVARGRHATPYMAWLALFQALLARHTDRDDLCVGSPTANRVRPADEALVGCFTAILPLRADLSGDVSFAGLLDRVRTTVSGALSHPDVPYERLATALGRPRDPDRQQFFGAWFNLHTEASGGPAGSAWAGIEVRDVPNDPPPARVDVMLDAWPAGDGLELILTVDPATVSAATAEALADRLPLLAARATAEPDRPLCTLPLAADGEPVARLVGPDLPPITTTVIEQVRAQAEQTPDAIALDADGGTLTYHELLTRADSLAARLPEVSGRLVAVAVPRGPELIVALAAVLAAGAGYLPIDPDQPPARTRAMLAGAGVAALLGTVPPGVDLGVPVVSLDSTDVNHAEYAPVDLDAIGYVLHTSGSTGEPKAVAVSHRAVAARVAWMRTAYRLGPGDRVTQLAPAGFDTHVEELFPALTSGATVVVPDVGAAELPDWLRRTGGAGVTVLDLSTAHWHELVRAGDAVTWPATLRTVILGGDRVAPAVVAEWFARFGDRVALWNTYGPTEATVIATAALLRPDETPDIGRPIGGVRAYVCDPTGAPVPVGVPGELCLGGEGVAIGYLGRPELTAARFADDPYLPGGRIYRTGDRARLLSDGTLSFLGRRDRQLKVRGFRIEPAEVEAALDRHPSVSGSAVVLRDDGARQSLVGYVVPAEPDSPGRGSKVDADEVRRYLAGVLPAHLVPSAVVLVERLPLTVRGKLDVAALPAVTGTDTAHVGYVEPHTDAEWLVADVWAEVLGVERVGADDDFFALGGHSLLATRVVSRLRSAADVDVPIRALFDAPTVAGLAAAVESALLADLDALSADELARLINEESPAR